MAHSKLAAFLLIFMVGSMVYNLAFYFEIIAEINKKARADRQFSYFSRDTMRMFEMHQRLYPDSKLRVAFVISLGLTVVFGLGLVFTQGGMR